LFHPSDKRLSDTRDASVVHRMGLTNETAGRYGQARLCALPTRPGRLLDASLHAGDEAGLIFEHAGNCIFHQLLGVLAIGGGYLLMPRFNVGREVHFHAFKVRENRQ
jgi:hypothetical protein